MTINLKKSLRNGLLTLVIAAGAGLSIAWAETPATQPTADTTDAASPAQPAKPTISADAQTELDAITAAYGKLKSLDLVGSMASKSVVDGDAHDNTSTFTSSFQAPVSFRHTMKDDIVAGCTGQKSFVFDTSKNIFVQDDAPKTKADFSNTPSHSANAVQIQNPSLFLALSEKAGSALTDQAITVSKTADEKLGDKNYTTLSIKSKTNTAVALIDPATHLLRQLRLNVLEEMKAHGAANMTYAMITIDYSSIIPDAPVKAEQFAWTPPEGAKDVAAMENEEVQAAIKATQGKPAPDFSMTDMDGKNVTLAGLKGQVVVLDFWATYCVPCRISLPGWDKYYQSKKADGLKFFGVNANDDKMAIQDFVTSMKLGLPMLIDDQGKTSAAYQIGPIPETVLIGRDGVVKKVIVSAEPSVDANFEEAIDAELAKK